MRNSNTAFFKKHLGEVAQALFAALSLGLVFFFMSGTVYASDSEDGQRVKITNLLVAGDESQVRVVLDISDESDFSTFFLSSPYRLVLDIHNSEFDIQNQGLQGDPGFLEKIRFGKSRHGDARLVITSQQPLRLNQSFFSPGSRAGAQRLVLDLAVTSEINFRLAIAREATKKLVRSTEKAEKAREPEDGQKGSEALEASPPERLARIMIDPGHGGRDGGATAVGNPDVLEKHLVLEFAMQLAEALKKRGGVEVGLTRSTDRKISLTRRIELAREFEADLFISIHADSFPRDRSVRGATIYTLSERASGEVAAIIAEQENRADFIAGYTFNEAPDDVVDILLDLTARETKALSAEFANYVINSMKSSIRFFKRPHQTGAFRVLKAPDIPSALIELGYLSNARDVATITSREWREKTAEQMAEVLIRYLNGLNSLKIVAPKGQ